MTEPYQYSELVYFPPDQDLEEKILIELNKRPLTSHELSHNLRVGVHNIIYWLNILEKKGNILSIEKDQVFYKLKKKLNRKDSKDGLTIIETSQDVLKPIENNDPKSIQNLRKNKKHSRRKVKEIQNNFHYKINDQQMYFLKFITKCDPHFRKLYNNTQKRG